MAAPDHRVPEAHIVANVVENDLEVVYMPGNIVENDSEVMDMPGNAVENGLEVMDMPGNVVENNLEAVNMPAAVLPPLPQFDVEAGLHSDLALRKTTPGLKLFALIKET